MTTQPHRPKRPNSLLARWGDQVLTSRACPGTTSTPWPERAEHRDKVALLELNADQDVAGRGEGEQEMALGHGRRRPERHEEAEIDRVPDHAVEGRRLELRLAGRAPAPMHD